MKCGIIIIIIGVIIAICHPQLTLQGAINGLNIWFFQLLPTLLPFMIVSNILLSKDITRPLLGAVSPWLQKRMRFLCILFNLFAGFTFGLPIGAKITQNLLDDHVITEKQGQILLNNCNVIGPSFVGGFFLTNKLQHPEWLGITFAIFYLPQLCCCVLSLLRILRTPANDEPNSPAIHMKKATPRLKNCFQILDVAIMNGFETITILGGYLIMFGILCMYIKELSIIPCWLNACLIAILEITSGIHEIAALAIPTNAKYLLSIPMLSFGGLCTAMQTRSIMRTTSLSIPKYLRHKIIYAGISAACALLFYTTLC